MKSKMIRLAVVLALLVSLFAVAAPPAMAGLPTGYTLMNDTANAWAGVSATTVYVGDTLVVTTDPVDANNVHWGGATAMAGVALTVKWEHATGDKETISTIPAQPITGTETGKEGEFTISFKVPATKLGSHTLEITDGANSVKEAITVRSRVKITSPATKKGTKGSEVTVAASGFNTSVGLTIYRDKGTVACGTGATQCTLDDDTDGDLSDEADLKVKATVATDSRGSATATFTMSATARIMAQDGKGAKFDSTTATAPKAVTDIQLWTLKPKITLDPTGGLVNKKVTVKGADFSKNATPGNTAIVSVSFGGATMTHQADNVEANLDAGEFIVKGGTVLVYGDATSFTLVMKVPANAPAGALEVKVINNGAGETTGTAKFTVSERTLSLTPTSGSVGISVQANASGFAAGKKGSVTATGLTTISGISINSAGSASASFTVPSGFGPGKKSNTITFTDDVGNVATATFTVPAASLTLDPIEGPPGTTVNFTGAGYAGHTTMTVTFTRPGGTPFNISTTPSVVVSDSLGNVTGSIVLPSSGTGTASIAVTDGTTSKSKDFTVKKAVETVQTALQTISDTVVIVWGYDAATQTYTKYDPAAPAVSDLAKLEKGKGYWINVSQDVTLVFGPGIYDLKAGWNLIGWLGS